LQGFWGFGVVVVVVVVVVVGAAVVDGSRHSQAVQKFVAYDPESLLQQAPPSQLQSALLLSSSQNPSFAHWGDPQFVGALVVGGCVVGA
jgi:hypothetical protein